MDTEPEDPPCHTPRVRAGSRRRDVRRRAHFVGAPVGMCSAKRSHPTAARDSNDVASTKGNDGTGIA